MAISASNLTWETDATGEEYLLLEKGRRFENPKNYLLPIPFAQTELNPNLKPNNVGW